MTLIPKNFQREMDLLWMLTQKEITLQYKRTTLGIFWTLLNPLFLAVVFHIAFSVILNIQTKEFPLFLLSALFPWTWFSQSINASTVSLIHNKSLIKKFPFPKHFLLIANVLSQEVHFLFSLPIIAFLVYYYNRPAGLNWFWGIPILLIIQFIITLGVSLAVSIINVYFYDFQFIVNFLLTMLFWLTPVLYSFDKIPAAYSLHFYYLNPLTPLISAWRELMMSGVIHWGDVAIALLGAVIVFIAGFLLFQRLCRRLDEVL